MKIIKVVEFPTNVKDQQLSCVIDSHPKRIHLLLKQCRFRKEEHFLVNHSENKLIFPRAALLKSLTHSDSESCDFPRLLFHARFPAKGHSVNSGSTEHHRCGAYCSS